MNDLQTEQEKGQCPQLTCCDPEASPTAHTSIFSKPKSSWADS